MDHLTCFLPGMLALGAEGLTHDRDLKLAEELMETCFDMYVCSVSGLAPEAVVFTEGSADYEVKDARYQLRPETMESLFILHRKTKNPKYREWSWKIFQAIVRHCKTDVGFSGILDVRVNEASPMDNVMPAYFLSETLKYSYLIQSEEDVFPISSLVFNTEAHALSILKRENKC